ncbi:MAG: NUDIX hydrolase [Chloracidobacterium sp.]|uniref:GDP-mannose pyrophosphatase n=1 Tax=Chloracidobacterium validum TaxID=2821543 RepID=A0ABX8B5J0_9BACT|nr:NUDIX hydrolase [Chloracidobacterium validum]QUW01876.1 NUDIX hydrolase [Chloracidobacterium validum]
MTIRPWRKLPPELLTSAKVFSVHRERAFPPDADSNEAAARDFYVIHTPDWVNVIPLTPANEVVLVEQYRHGVHQVTLEIPGGMVDAEDPSPAAAAARELEEETGYVATSIEPLGDCHPNPAIQNNRCYSFVARGAQKLKPTRFDGNEDLAVRLVPLKDIPALITTGAITHALVIVAFHRLSLLTGVRYDG